MPSNNLIDMMNAASAKATGVAKEVLSYKATRVLLGPVIDDVPTAYANFTQQHLKARNLMFMFFTIAGFTVGLALAVAYQPFRVFLDEWVNIPILSNVLNSISPTLSYIYRGSTFASYLTSWVSDALFKIYFAIICGDREYNLEEVYCEKVLLPKEQTMPIAEVAQALGITPEELKTEFEKIRHQYRKAHFANGSQAKDLEELMKAFMSRDPIRIAETYNAHKTTANISAASTSASNPQGILTQYQRTLTMVCPERTTTYGTAELHPRGRTSTSLLAGCCPA